MAGVGRGGRLHVLIVCFDIFEYAVQLANALAETCQVTLALPDRAEPRCAAMVHGTVRLHRFHMPRLRYPTGLRMVRDLLRTIRELRPDVVHQTSWNPWFSLGLPLLPEVAYVATIHDVVRHPGDRASFEPLLSWQWRRADAVIVHADAVRRQLLARARLPADRVHVVRIGTYDVYREWADQTAREQTNSILFFGRLWEYKGLRFLIAAEPLITAAVPDARIVIAGEGEPFEKYARLMVHPDRFVVHNRRIPDDEVPRLFQEASLVALPYVEASQSAVVALAFAFGKPVVATAVGGLPEVVRHGETGLLVPPGDSGSLAAAIVALLQDPAERARMGQRARELARSSLSWEQIAGRTVAVYEAAGTTRASRRA